MPELPEVETIVRTLAPRLTGATLRNPKILKTDVLRRVRATRLLKILNGAKVLDVTRRAKHIVINLGGGGRLVVQLRMTGNLVLFDRRLRRSDQDHLVMRVGVGGGATLVYRDVRRLGTISLLNEREWTTYTERIGPEPLDDAFGPAAFHQILVCSSQAIKKVIMDQRRVAGIGNIYANEALFRARIDPSTPSNRVTEAAATKLFNAVREVLTEAIRAGGTTIRDYRNGSGQPGSYQRVLDVYGRNGEPCVTCGTRLHTTHAVDGRATTLCWRCQAGSRTGGGVQRRT